jgi:hypothetical protein
VEPDDKLGTSIPEERERERERGRWEPTLST